MGKDELKRFAVIHNYWNGSVGDLKRMEKLIDRFGADRVGKAFQHRENKLRNGRDPLYDKWEKSRQYA